MPQGAIFSLVASVMFFVVVQMIVTLHTAFEYLARVAVFIEQARIGENLAINENVSFEDEFRQLEDDHEAVFVLRTVSQLTTTRIQSSCRCTVK